jgi:hypothetical protein
MDREASRKRAMADTTVIVAGICWPRWPHEVLQARSGRFIALSCHAGPPGAAKQLPQPRKPDRKQCLCSARAREPLHAGCLPPGL